jgi:hypothetical protein
MDYTPRHPQPFTLEQAILLDVTILSEGQAVSSSIYLTSAYPPPEITRLQNSLEHLKRTQEELREHVATSSSPDPDFIEAISENEEVMFVG